jgi:hypothetical protein
MEWSVSHNDRLYLEEKLRAPQQKARLPLGRVYNFFRGEEASCPCRESKHDFSDVRPVAQLLYRLSHPSWLPHIGREHVSPPLQEQVFNAAYRNTADFQNHTTFKHNLWSNCSVPL